MVDGESKRPGPEEVKDTGSVATEAKQNENQKKKETCPSLSSAFEQEGRL